MACGVALATTSSYFRQRKKKKRARIHFYHPIFSPHVNIRIDQKNKLAAVQYVLFYVKKHQIFEPKKTNTTIAFETTKINDDKKHEYGPRPQLFIFGHHHHHGQPNSQEQLL